MNFSSIILHPFNTTCAEKEPRAIPTIYVKKLDHMDIITPLARFQIKPIPTKNVLFIALVELQKKCHLGAKKRAE